MNVLITGATGSFGNAFLTRILQEDYSKIIVFSRDEKKQWDMAKKFTDPRIRYFIGDIRDKDRLRRAFSDMNVVIHAAALKQVVALEYNPIEAIMTNVIGTQNVINASIDAGVDKVMLVSTDKAVNPVNLYGATKLCAEKLMVASNVYGKTKFSVVRYGNVVGSRGSVLSLFEEQMKSGKLTVTDKRMTRFWVTLEGATEFVNTCLDKMQGGEIFVPKLKSKKIVDLAREVCPDCELVEIGIRDGEKLHEVLISEDESRYVKEYDGYYVIDKDNELRESFVYSSNDNTI